MPTTDLEKVKFNICFCQHQDKILMVYRNKHPNQHKWNGLGGKIEPGESPRQSIHREFYEESGVDLGCTLFVKYVGIVTWNAQNQAWETGGMHAFIAQLPDSFSEQLHKVDTNEGKLDWKSLSWIFNPKNNRIVPGLSKFLPHMLQTDNLHEYQFTYHNRMVTNFQILIL